MIYQHLPYRSLAVTIQEVENISGISLPHAFGVIGLKEPTHGVLHMDALDLRWLIRTGCTIREPDGCGGGHYKSKDI